MKQLFILTVCLITTSIFASDVVPTGGNNNTLYYRMGGGSDFALPPVQDTHTINLNANSNLGPGYMCGAFNPALSISNSLNELKNSEDNVEQSILTNATGSLIEMPMYFLAQANPTAYNMINNALVKIHEQISLSTKSCQDVRNQITAGKNPYQDWATLSVGDQWKQHLSLTANGQEDINDAKTDVDQHAGNNGVSWVQGSTDSNDSGFHAGGLNQPPIHVIADTVKAGYNAMLMRDLNDSSPAPKGSDLADEFPQPSDAQAWVTNVVGDQTIAICNDPTCIKQQGGVSGRGLLPWITTCNDQNQNYCADNIRTNLVNLISGKTAITKQNLENVSASNLVISPQVITAIQNMDPTQQSIVTGKLAQEVATQKIVDRALVARNMLQTGSQVPVISSNQPAQKVVYQAIQNLDKDIQSLAFESHVRKQMMSDTLTNVLDYQTNQQGNAVGIPKVIPQQPLMENSAMPNSGGKNK